MTATDSRHCRPLYLAVYGIPNDCLSLEQSVLLAYPASKLGRMLPDAEGRFMKLGLSGH
jgi:hypothetical protein